LTTVTCGASGATTVDPESRLRENRFPAEKRYESTAAELEDQLLVLLVNHVMY
jgi:hypothetical protein